MYRAHKLVLANVGGKDLHLSVFRDHDPRAIDSDAFRKVLLAFKRLRGYTDAGAPGRNWNDATDVHARRFVCYTWKPFHVAAPAPAAAVCTITNR